VDKAAMRADIAKKLADEEAAAAAMLPEVKQA